MLLGKKHPLGTEIANFYQIKPKYYGMSKLNQTMASSK